MSEEWVEVNRNSIEEWKSKILREPEKQECI